MAEAIFKLAVEWIASMIIQEHNKLLGVADQVEVLRQELALMQAYLQDADARQEEGEIGTLVRQIRKLAYDAEDLIDTYILHVGAKASKDSWISKYAFILYNSPHIYGAGKQMEVILTRIKRITKRLNRHGVRKTVEPGECSRQRCDEGYWRRQPPSYSYEDKNCEYVVGLDEGISKLVEVILGEENTRINIVCIMGMGGCGKTTLARKLYNHPDVKKCFNYMAWVFISQEWSIRHILSEILSKVGGPQAQQTSDLHAKLSEQELVNMLRCILQEKLYLVILDDVWRRDALEEILPALPWGIVNRGSKIIVTTRNREIVQLRQLQQHTYVYEPQPLSEAETWMLFSNIALNHRTDCNIDKFESLGKEMLKKCGGLPLAVVALAGILNTRGSIGQWQQVSEAVGSRVLGDRCTKVQDLLALSYDDLPVDLKPCFLYLGMFPEDCQIPSGLLCRMWIAEGLVVAREMMSPEDVAMQNLEKLSQRFMIQITRINSMGSIKTIQLHDLLRELCLRKAKEQNFLQIYSSMGDQTNTYFFEADIQPRRVALHSSFCLPTEISNLRSLVLLLNSSILGVARVSTERINLKILHQNFKLLRLLNLDGIKTDDGTLPKEIGSLIHLRYLGIHASNIIELPMSIGKLRNLLTFDYRNIVSDHDILVKIPNVFSKLKQLRHLFLPIECPWSLMDLQLSYLENLQVLWGIKQNIGDNWFSREVPRLSTTIKKLKIVVSTEQGLKDSFTCPSLKFDRLQIFHCELENGLAFQGLEDLSNCEHLHKMLLTGPMRMNLSLMLPVNLLKLELKNSMLKDEDSIVALGALAHLKVLRVSNFFIGTALVCNRGSFPQLEEFYLDNLQNLQNLTIHEGALPFLKTLEIANCPCLQELPLGLDFVAKLQQLNYFDMPAKFCEIAANRGWGDYESAPNTTSSWKKMRRTYPFEDDEEKIVIGFKDDIQKLVEIVMGERSQVRIISIVGIGGSGKSTLARKVYNHLNAKKCFDCMAWVFISQEWSIRNILRQMLRKVYGPKETNKLLARLSEEELRNRLRNTLKNKSFLVVLDDLWSREALEEILPALPWENSTTGSKIVITSRNRMTVSMPYLKQHLHVHEPQPLNAEESWLLFKNISLNHQKSLWLHMLRKTSTELLTKCNGLPLAIIALSEIMNNIEAMNWMTLYDDVISRILDHTCTNMYGSVHDVLYISYDDLPDSLKACFLYFGQFPKNCEIPAGMLTRMWAAEALVSTQEQMSLEDVAMQVLEELNNRFMIQVSRRNVKGVIKAIQIPTLVYELCVRKTREDGFPQSSSPINCLARTSKDKAILPPSCRAVLPFSTSLPTEVPNLTSLTIFPRSAFLCSLYVSKVMLELEMETISHHFKLLKVLNLWGVKTSNGTLPGEIGNLIHLRYLGLRATNITQLPTSIGKLSNLLTFDYRNVESEYADDIKLIEFPEGLWTLVLLRNLFLPVKCCWRRQQQLRLRGMKNLQVLWGVRCYGDINWFSTDLSELNTNLKKLKLILSTEDELKAVFDFLKLELNHLHTFHCKWRAEIALQFVKPISHNPFLHKLVLNGRVHLENLADILPSTLLKLVLKNSMLENDPMSSIGGALANLKFLKLSYSYMGTVFTCGISSFPMLEELIVDHHPNLTTWIKHEGSMPCLKKLEIARCPKLQIYPSSWPIHLQYKFVEMPKQAVLTDVDGLPTTVQERVWNHY